MNVPKQKYSVVIRMLILYFLAKLLQNQKCNLADLSAIKIVQHVALRVFLWWIILINVIVLETRVLFSYIVRHDIHYIGNGKNICTTVRICLYTVRLLAGRSFFYFPVPHSLSLRDICNSIKLKREWQRAREKRRKRRSRRKDAVEDDVAESAFVSGSAGVKR